MSIAYNTSTVTNGLVYSVDPSNRKSFLLGENLVLRSQEFNNASWAKANTTVSADGAYAPDGTLTADLVSNTPSANSYVGQTVNLSATTTYTLSVYVKPNTTNKVLAMEVDQTGAGSYLVATYNLSTLTSSGSGTRSIIDVGRGWYRLVFTFTTSTGTPKFNVFYIGAYGSTADAVNMYLWGAQIEKSGTANIYTPTAGSAITGSTVVSDLSPNGITGALSGGPGYLSTNNGIFTLNGTSAYINVPNFKNYFAFNSAFTISAWINPSNSSSVDIVSTYNPGSNDGIWLELATASNQIRFVSRSLGTGIFDLYSSETIGTGSWKHIVATYDATTAKIYINGVQSVNTAAATTLFSIVNPDLFIGRIDSSLGRYLAGSVGPVSIYNRAISATEVSTMFNSMRGRYSL